MNQYPASVLSCWPHSSSSGVPAVSNSNPSPASLSTTPTSPYPNPSSHPGSISSASAHRTIYTRTPSVITHAPGGGGSRNGSTTSGVDDPLTPISQLTDSLTPIITPHEVQVKTEDFLSQHGFPTVNRQSSWGCYNDPNDPVHFNRHGAHGGNQPDMQNSVCSNVLGFSGVAVAAEPLTGRGQMILHQPRSAHQSSRPTVADSAYSYAMGHHNGNAQTEVSYQVSSGSQNNLATNNLFPATFGQGVYLTDWSNEEQYPSTNGSNSLAEFLPPIGHSYTPWDHHFFTKMPTHTPSQQYTNNRFSPYNVKTPNKARGGRRPKEEEFNIPPEDVEKRKLRRQRNKEAAARCRQRRLDHMAQLQSEVDALEQELGVKKDEIEQLKEEKSRLEHFLHNHDCKVVGLSGNGFMHSVKFVKNIKSEHFGVRKIDPEQTLTEVVTQAYSDAKHDLMSPPLTSISGLERPCNLTLASAGHGNPFPIASTPGIPISTPSAGVNLFGDLLSQPTGLTPINPNGFPSILHPSNGLSLETPTSGMDTENGIVKGSLCHL